MIVADKILAGRCRVVELDQSWYVDELGTTKGNRTKFIAIALLKTRNPIRNPYRPWFWKASLDRYPIEFWSEVCAYHIGSSIGVDVPPCFPARYGERYGALSMMMIDRSKRETLVHGGDLLTGRKPDYERKRGSDHSVQLVIETLKDRKLHTAIYPSLFRQFLLDAILGNVDRHQDNWGLRARPDPSGDNRMVFNLLPAFDNGSSLGRELTTDRVHQMLEDEAALDRYILKGKAHIRWRENGNLVQVSHEELIRRHMVAFPASRAVLEGFLGFNLGRVERSIRRICSLSRTCPGVELSEDREELMVRLVSRRTARLASLLDE